jgi:hypothetical protein
VVSLCMSTRVHGHYFEKHHIICLQTMDPSPPLLQNNQKPFKGLASQAICTLCLTGANFDAELCLGGPMVSQILEALPQAGDLVGLWSRLIVVEIKSGEGRFVLRCDIACCLLVATSGNPGQFTYCSFLLEAVFCAPSSSPCCSTIPMDLR